MKIEYAYIEDDIVNVLVCKPSQNKKLGIMSIILGTYHFGMDQVLSANLTNDSKSCLECPMSYTNSEGKSGGCYTHGGMQRLGLNGMLKRLSRELKAGNILPFSKESFDNFVTKVSKVDISLTRFGIYGEPVLLGIDIVKKLSSLSKTWTAYTHNWHKEENKAYADYFMASTHSAIETSIANDMGWRVFNVGCIEQATGCPAAKENGRKSTCTQCSLCSGVKGKGKKNVFILKH